MTAPTDRKDARTEGALWALEAAAELFSKLASECCASEVVNTFRHELRALAARVRSGEIAVPEQNMGAAREHRATANLCEDGTGITSPHHAAPAQSGTPRVNAHVRALGEVISNERFDELWNEAYRLETELSALRAEREAAKIKEPR